MSSISNDDVVKHFVAIDIGSNSLHLVVVSEQNNQRNVIHKQKKTIRLASGLNKNNILNEQSITLAMSCLKEFFATFEHLPNCKVAIVATYALRQAKNKQQFIDQAANIIPYPINIISGEQEANLIFFGVAYTKDILKPTLIIDIGGGSTEFIIGDELTPTAAESLNMGCVSYTEQFFSKGEITLSAMTAAKSLAQQSLKTIAQQYINLGWQKVLGTSGSMKAITQIMLELYGDKKISLERLLNLQHQLINWGHYNNISLNSLSDKRRPLLASAIAILLACFESLNIEKLKYNSGGVREGLLYQLKLEQQ